MNSPYGHGPNRPIYFYQQDTAARYFLKVEPGCPTVSFDGLHLPGWQSVIINIHGILPNQDLLQVASAEEESEKDTRLWAGQDPN